MRAAIAAAIATLLLAGCATRAAVTPSIAPVIDVPPLTGELYRNNYTQEQDSVPKAAHAVDYNAISEPVPKAEPPGKYGNKSPYVVLGKTYRVLADARGYTEEGVASWYGNKFSGFRTSSMETYDPYAMTAAHKTLPIPGYARVTNLENGRSVIVRVNDRGPFKKDRLIDLSWAAANKLGYANVGTARVRVEAIVPDANPPGDADDRTIAVATATAAAIPGIDTGFFVQLGAYALESSARALAEDVRGTTGEPVRVATGSEQPAPLNRVRVGPYADRAAATRIRDLLRNAGYADALVIPAP